jgi:hypothetical protein
MRSMTSFRGEVKLAVPCCEISWHIKDPYSMKEILVSKIHTHFLPSFSCFATRYLLITARALVGGSRMIRTQMGKHNRSVMVAVYEMPCATDSCQDKSC